MAQTRWTYAVVVQKFDQARLGDDVNDAAVVAQDGHAVDAVSQHLADLLQARALLHRLEQVTPGEI